MEKIDITISFDAEKMDAVKIYLKKEETTVQKKLDEAMRQLDAVWIVLGTAAQGSLTEEQWQTTLNAVRSLTEMDGLEDMILCTNIPAGGFLSAGALQDLLSSVQAALAEIQDHSGTEPFAQEMT